MVYLGESKTVPPEIRKTFVLTINLDQRIHQWKINKIDLQIYISFFHIYVYFFHILAPIHTLAFFDNKASQLT